MAETVRLSNKFIEATARKIWPQGKAFAEIESGEYGHVVFGKIHRGFHVEGERVVGPRVERERAASPTIGSIRLEDRRAIISKCKAPLNIAAEATGILAGVVAIDGAVRNRSARRVVSSILGGAAVWIGTRVVVEICDQTIENLDKRITLLDKMASATPQEPKPRS
jgi:hypothetical protein